MAERRVSTARFVRHDAIVRHLRGQIVRGKLPPGARLPAQLDLQQQFGTTPVTVQRAFDRLSDENFIGRKTNQGSFVSEHPPHLWHYGLLFPDHPPGPDVTWKWSRFFTSLALAAEDVSRLGPRRVRIYHDVNGHVDSEGYQHLLRDLDTGRLAGLMYAFAPHDLVGTRLLEARPKVPRVAANFHVKMMPIIGPIGEGGSAFPARAVEWLRTQGRRNVAVITIPQESRDRMRRAIDEAGATSLPFWTQAVEPHHTQWVLHAVHAILHSDPQRRPDGLIVTDDHLVEAVADALLELGVRVPDDILVVGHWNFPLPYTRRVPIRLLGIDNVELMRRWIATIDAQRRGESITARQTIEPIFDDAPRCSAKTIQELPAPMMARQR